MKNRKGFTLVEVLVVVFIIGLLVAIAVPSITAMSKRFSQKGLNSKIELIEESAVNFAQERSNSIKKCKDYKCKDGFKLCKDDDKPEDCKNGIQTTIGLDPNGKEKYIVEISLERLVELGGYESEDENKDIVKCDVSDPTDSSYCLDCGTVTIYLDDKYKTAEAVYTLPADEKRTLTRCS